MATVQQIRHAQRSDGPAAVLAIGTANPASCMLQNDYADYYFRVTNSEHHADLKDKLKRICKNSGIERRYVHLDEELLGAHPDFSDRALLTLRRRARRPAPRPPVPRTLRSRNGCSGGGRALQLAKELAENNRGARVLVACSELTLIGFYGPQEGRLDTILGNGIFGDGAGAVIVGADHVDCIERPLFEMAFATQTTIPETENEITTRLMKGGLDFHVSIRVPKLLKSNIERCLIDTFESIGISAEWNDLFWAIHPGGRAILDHVEQLLGLGVEKLAASRRVLREYGNMSAATVIFVLDELRRRRARGEEVAEWGVMMAFGPGITIETMVLHAAGSLKEN
ncbi:Curcuminoid synthase [Triticum urartu]|uniref:Curcuminoid synthase n=1 Tax=Triticum urartu TaxID=4572 RepID=M7ZN18_TRIUA|nr:Curcuminoid synthase [Triticum urartu]